MSEIGADEISELRARLETAEDTLRAIRRGEVDGLIIDDGTGARVYALRTADAPYRALVEQMDDGAATLDTEGRIMYCNRRLAELMRVPLAQVIGEQIGRFFSNADAATVSRLIEHGTGKARVRLRRPDSQALDVHASVSPVVLDGTSYRTLIITDVSTLMQMQQENRAKDVFLAMLAHELRNPLAPVRTGVRLLRDFDLDRDKSRRIMDMIERQVTHLTHLVDDLLDVSRIAQGKVTLKREAVALNGLLRDAIDLARPLIDAKRHRLTLTVPGEVLYLNADAARLTQVIGNLLSNAAKYTDEGGEIALLAERAQSSVVLRVRDNGIGIDQDLLPHVFDLFTQGHVGLDRALGGLGIGLSLVKSLVALHGGEVEANSAGIGRGSEFSVRLPLIAPPHAEPATSAQTCAYVPRRVLLVDDNIDAAQSMGMLLEMGNHSVHYAHDGLSALEVARAMRPEVALLDIGLPGIDGFELARRLRASPETRDAALIALTGYGQEEDRLRSAQAGFDHHLVKPVEPNVLLQTISIATERRRSE